MTIRPVILFFLLIATSGALGSLTLGGPPGGIPPGQAKKSKQGNYTFKIGGHYAGEGTGTVKADSISITCDVRTKDGQSGKLVVTNLTVDDEGNFSGAGTICGQSMTISGRVDIPTGEDAEQTDEQADTGRVSAILKSADGNTAKVVGIQSEKSDGSKPGKGIKK